jgi:type VI protein secretion system component VasF
MTEVDELLARLRKLPAVELDGHFKAAVQARAHQRMRGASRRAPFASLASLALGLTVVLYLGWALQFTSALYR